MPRYWILDDTAGQPRPLDRDHPLTPQGVVAVVGDDSHFIAISGLTADTQVNDPAVRQAVEEYFGTLGESQRPASGEDNREIIRGYLASGGPVPIAVGLVYGTTRDGFPILGGEQVRGELRAEGLIRFDSHFSEN